MVMITQKKLVTLLDYNPDSGIFVWKKRSSDNSYSERIMNSFNSRLSGKEAGTVTPNGYRRIIILGHSMSAHTLAWIYTTGEPPTGEIDHINGNRDGNRFCNMRNVSRLENMRNKSLYKNNSTGCIGVSPEGKGWKSRIRIEGVEVYLGYFSVLQDAVSARKKAEIKYKFHKNHGRIRNLV
jgi:hypothetical protein